MEVIWKILENWDFQTECLFRRKSFLIVDNNNNNKKVCLSVWKCFPPQIKLLNLETYM